MILDLRNQILCPTPCIVSVITVAPSGTSTPHKFYLPKHKKEHKKGRWREAKKRVGYWNFIQRNTVVMWKFSRSVLNSRSRSKNTQIPLKWMQCVLLWGWKRTRFVWPIMIFWGSQWVGGGGGGPSYDTQLGMDNNGGRGGEFVVSPSISEK